MKKLAIAITFFIFLFPLIIIGVLDYKLSEYGISYKDRVINLKKSNIEFHNMIFKKGNCTLKSPVVVVKFNLLKPTVLNISANSIKEIEHQIIAKDLHIDIKDFYKTINLTVKSVDIKKYDIKCVDFNIVKKFSDVNGSFSISEPINILNLWDHNQSKTLYEIFFKETPLIFVNNPFKFSIEMSEFPVYKISTNNIKIGNVDFENIKVSASQLKDLTYRTSAIFKINKQSDFKINGTVIKLQPMSAKFKMLLNNVGLFDVVLGNQYKKNKIYNTVSKFFNINIDNIIKSFDFCIENGRFRINL